MSCNISRIGYSLVIVFVLACGAAYADDNYVYPPGAEPSAFYYQPLFGLPIPPHGYDSVNVPDLELIIAYEDFKGERSKADPILTLNSLRIFALSKRLDKVRENLNWAIAQGWDEDFIDLFRRSIEWGDHIWHSDGAYVWEQSKIEEDRSPHDSHAWVKLSLEQIARKNTPLHFMKMQFMNI